MWTQNSIQNKMQSLPESDLYQSNNTIQKFLKIIQKDLKGASNQNIMYTVPSQTDSNTCSDILLSSLPKMQVY